MRALQNFPGLPLRPEMLVHAMANKGSPRHVTSPHQTASPHIPLAGVSPASHTASVPCPDFCSNPPHWAAYVACPWDSDFS